MNLKQINNILYFETDNTLKLNKGKDYFYFTSDKGKLPDSILTKSAKNIYIQDINEAIKFFNENN